MKTEAARRHLLHGQQELLLGKIVALLREDEVMANRALLMLEPGQLRVPVSPIHAAQH